MFFISCLDGEEYYDIALILFIYDITIFPLWYDTSPTTHCICCIVGKEITRDVQKSKTRLPSREIVQIAEEYYDITLFLSMYDITIFLLWYDTSPTTHCIYCIVGKEITRDVQKCKTMLQFREIVQVAEGYYEFTLFLSMYESHDLSYDMTLVWTSATAFCVSLARESHVMCIRALFGSEWYNQVDRIEMLLYIVLCSEMIRGLVCLDLNDTIKYIELTWCV